MKDKIPALPLENGQSTLLHKDEHTKLIISYSQRRAAKDAYNRERAIKKPEQHIKSGRLTRASINNRGYNKFLTIDNTVNISINKDKIEEDKKWDGLKGYSTSMLLSKDEIIENYKNLWQIEKAFRIARTDLKIRPIYHRVKRRIEAHICIAFVAYKIYKEPERQLKEKQSSLRPGQAINIAKTIFAIKSGISYPMVWFTAHYSLLGSNAYWLLYSIFKPGCPSDENRRKFKVNSL
jgi:transposase